MDTPYQNLKGTVKKKSGKEVEKRERFHTVGRTVNCYSYYGKWYGDSSTNYN